MKRLHFVFLILLFCTTTVFGEDIKYFEAIEGNNDVYKEYNTSNLYNEEYKIFEGKIYFDANIVENVDLTTFNVVKIQDISTVFAFDENYIYNKGKIIDNIVPNKEIQVVRYTSFINRLHAVGIYYDEQYHFADMSLSDSKVNRTDTWISIKVFFMAIFTFISALVIGLFWGIKELLFNIYGLIFVITLCLWIWYSIFKKNYDKKHNIKK